MFDREMWENRCSVKGHIAELEEELADLKTKWFATLDEDEADKLYGEDIADIEQELYYMRSKLDTMIYMY